MYGSDMKSVRCVRCVGWTSVQSTYEEESSEDTDGLRRVLAKMRTGNRFQKDHFQSKKGKGHIVAWLVGCVILGSTTCSPIQQAIPRLQNLFSEDALSGHYELNLTISLH